MRVTTVFTRVALVDETFWELHDTDYLFEQNNRVVSGVFKVKDLLRLLMNEVLALLIYLICVITCC